MVGLAVEIYLNSTGSVSRSPVGLLSLHYKSNQGEQIPDTSQCLFYGGLRTLSQRDLPEGATTFSVQPGSTAKKQKQKHLTPKTSQPLRPTLLSSNRSTVASSTSGGGAGG